MREIYMKFQTYDGFIKALPKLYQKLTTVAHSYNKGTLFCAATPVLKLKDCNNHSLDDGGAGTTSVLVCHKCIFYG